MMIQSAVATRCLIFPFFLPLHHDLIWAYNASNWTMMIRAQSPKTKDMARTR